MRDGRQFNEFHEWIGQYVGRIMYNVDDHFANAGLEPTKSRQVQNQNRGKYTCTSASAAPAGAKKADGANASARSSNSQRQSSTKSSQKNGGNRGAAINNSEWQKSKYEWYQIEEEESGDDFSEMGSYVNLGTGMMR